MKLKLFLIFITLVVYSEAFKSSFIKNLSNNIVLDQSSNSPPNTYPTRLDRNVNLIVNAYVSGQTVPIAIDTKSEFWFVSNKCTSSFCTRSGKTKGGIPDGENTASAHGEAVQGTQTTMKLQLDESQDPMEVEVVAANHVNPIYAKKLDQDVYGVLGLGPNTKLLNSLKPSLLVSLYIDDDDKNPSNALYFNELPPSLKDEDYATLSFAKSTRADEWRFQIGYIGTNYGLEHQWCKYGCPAVINMYYPSISGPAKDIYSLNKYLGADKDGYIDCYKKYRLEPLIFHIEGVRYPLSPASFIVKSDDPFTSKCKTIFEPTYTYNGLWTLGYPFINKRVTVFDYAEKQLAFLPLSSNSK